MKNDQKLKFVTLISLLLIFITWSASSDAAKKKKVYVNVITAKEGISKSLAKNIHDHITLSIFENFSNKYQIITDDDIKVMYQKAELMMAAGVESENTVVQIANAINADEMARQIKSPRSSNMVMLGAASPFLDVPYESLENGIKKIFGRKGEKVVNLNIESLKAGREFAIEHTPVGGQ